MGRYRKAKIDEQFHTAEIRAEVNKLRSTLVTVWNGVAEMLYRYRSLSSPGWGLLLVLISSLLLDSCDIGMDRNGTVPIGVGIELVVPKCCPRTLGCRTWTMTAASPMESASVSMLLGVSDWVDHHDDAAQDQLVQPRYNYIPIYPAIISMIPSNKKSLHLPIVSPNFIIFYILSDGWFYWWMY